MQTIERTLFIHCGPVKDDGVIRFDGMAWLYHNVEGKLSGKKMKVWIVENPHDFHTLTHRLIVYSSPVADNESFIGYADYRETL